ASTRAALGAPTSSLAMDPRPALLTGASGTARRPAAPDRGHRVVSAVASNAGNRARDMARARSPRWHGPKHGQARRSKRARRPGSQAHAPAGRAGFAAGFGPMV